MKVAFNGIVTTNSGTQGIYVEDYDPETDRYYGIYVYYGHGLNGMGLNAIKVGNETRIVGSVQFYEAGGSWQVSDLSYDMMDPRSPNNLLKLSEGHAAAYVPIAAQDIASDWAQLALGTTVELAGLNVVEAYTTQNGGSSDGAITLTCVKEDVTVTVRTIPMRDGEGNPITQDAFLDKTIDVRGVVDYFDGAYQIKVFTPDNITIN
jgi:hypothetical protein